MLKKNLALILMLALCKVIGAAEIAAVGNEKPNYLVVLTQEVKPETTIIAFDINDVLFKKSVPEIIGRSLWTLVRGGLWHVMWPSFWKKVKELNATTGSKEYVFVKLQETYPALKGWEQDYLALSTSHTIVHEMIEIVNALKAQGYKLYLFSNMGTVTVDAMRKKFPQVFTLFDGEYLPTQQNGYNYKPMPSFYREFKAYLAAQGETNKQIVFIDDRIENLQEANNNGIAGIECISVAGVHEKLMQIGALEE